MRNSILVIAAMVLHLLFLRMRRLIPCWRALTICAVAISSGESTIRGQELEPPAFVQEPASRTVTVGLSITFTATATGSLPLSYQWRFNEQDVPGATARSYVLRSVRIEDAGLYRVAVSNAAGFVLSSNATLTVTQQPPRIVAQPINKKGLVGSTATFAAGAAGSLPLFYQWRFKDEDLPGATNSSVNVAISSKAEEGNYRLQVTNAFGSVLSSNAFLSVVDLGDALDATNLAWSSSGVPGWLPVFGGSHDGIDSAYSGEVTSVSPSRLETTLMGPGTLTFWWWFNPRLLSSLYVEVDGETRAVAANSLNWQPLTLFIGDGRHVVRWICFNVNLAGPVSASLDQVGFQPGETLVMLRRALTNMQVAAGTDAILSVEADGTPPFHYEWRFNGEVLAGAVEPMLRINNVQAEASGRYELIVSNQSGSAATMADLVVRPSAPTILFGSVDQKVLLRHDVALLVIGRGTEPLFYQWTHNGIPIEGATNWLLSLPHIGTNDLGEYAVSVQNTEGMTSRISTLSRKSTLLLGWGANESSQSAPRFYDMTAVIAAGDTYSLSVSNDGRASVYGTGPGSIPVSASNAIAVAAGAAHALVLRADGSVVGFGSGAAATVPAGLGMVVDIAAGTDTSVALRRDGRVVVWGEGSEPLTRIPASLSNVTTIACGRYHALALKSDSRVSAWGVEAFGDTQVPPGLEGVVAIACGSFHSIALKADGTVVCWGDNQFGQCTPPPALDSVVAIAGGLEHSMALRGDGTVVVWGSNNAGQSTVPAIVHNAVAIASGERHCLALLNDGSPFVGTRGGPYSVQTGGPVSFMPRWMGEQPLQYHWLHNGLELPGATNPSFLLEEAMLADAGTYQCIGKNEFGTLFGPIYQLVVERTIPKFGTSPLKLNFGAGGLGLEVTDLAGHAPMVLYASTNLARWDPIYTNPTPVLGTVRVLDPDALKLPRRFYRAEEP